MKIPRVKAPKVTQLTFSFPRRKSKQVQLTLKFPKTKESKLNKLA